MQGVELMHRLGIALAIGLIVGVERHWREREMAAGQRTAGVRTYGVTGLLGGLAAAVAVPLGKDVVGAGLLLGFVLGAFSVAFVVFKMREAEAEGDFSVTSVIVAQATFLLGALAVAGDVAAAGAAAVAMTALLASRHVLHRFLQRLTWAELRSAIVLLAMTFVALPLVPDEGFAALAGLNPRRVWLLAIVLAAVSYAGYIAVKLFGARWGHLAAGAAGGLVSSTAVTVANARRAADGTASASLVAGASLAGAVAYLRTAALVLAVAPETGLLLLPALAAGALAQGLAALSFAWRGADEAGAVQEQHNPFEFLAVLKIAALLAAVGVAGDVAARFFGQEAVLAVAAVSGLADVDAVSLAVAGLVPQALTASGAALAVAVAVASNTLAKAGYALALGGRGYGLAFAAASLLALAAGAAALVALPA
ncbi:DUF4010 domain-containing protein [Chelatococcus sp. SYSU_G07232]|uniref:DUF4010 domain-containing protein n=1 Tax=Chelatococcus albus TaxID=3047466 RepID=A0ABT7AEI6_9HYPH|nr:DUF4010 domain-containing protein [Chelatococcus sp. SYSU_G07232]MDJ1157254.1 DUF4010 domain-containing protein [Chelatococcus sp. SYSU_G07232]